MRAALDSDLTHRVRIRFTVVVSAGTVIEGQVKTEEQIARLESDVEHLRTIVADLKADLRARLDRMDVRLDRLESKLESRRNGS